MYLLRYNHSRSSIGSPNPPPPHTHLPSTAGTSRILDARESDDEKLAVDILFRAIQVRLWSRPTSRWSRPSPLRPAFDPPPLSRAELYPINQIAFNAGEEGALVLEKVKDKEFGYGWNAANGEYGNLFEMGVIDPATVTQQAIIELSTRVGVTTNCLITEIREEEPPMMAGRRRRPDGRHAWHVDSDDGEAYRRHPALPPSPRPTTHPLRETCGLRPSCIARVAAP